MKQSEAKALIMMFSWISKRTCWIVGNVFRSEAYIKEFKNRSEANTFDSVKIYFEAKRTMFIFRT